MVNEVLADMLYESAKTEIGQKSGDPKQHFYRLQLAPKDSDFPDFVDTVEMIRSQASVAKDSADKEIGATLEKLEMLFYQEMIYVICSTSSEAGKLVRTLQTSTTEYTNRWEGGQKDKGMQGYFQRMGQKQVV